RILLHLMISCLDDLRTTSDSHLSAIISFFISRMNLLSGKMNVHQLYYYLRTYLNLKDLLRNEKIEFVKI
ncbi:MAG: hypothetical protein ACTSO9_19680, partial [Candidatus Helarchaeota archaeon]